MQHQDRSSQIFKDLRLDYFHLKRDMPPQPVLICLGLLLQVVVVFGQTKYRVDETDSPLPQHVLKTLKSGKPTLEMIFFNASYKCSKEYLVETKDHIYVDFVAGNPDSRLTLSKPGPQVIVGIEKGSNLIICIKDYTDCGPTYSDVYGLPCNCKNISTQEYTAVRVKGYWKLNPTASGGHFMIIWEESVDRFLNPVADPINITVSRKVPKIVEEDPSCDDHTEAHRVENISGPWNDSTEAHRVENISGPWNSESDDGTSWVMIGLRVAYCAILVSGSLIFCFSRTSTDEEVIGVTDGQERSEDAQDYRPSNKREDPSSRHKDRISGSEDAQDYRLSNKREDPNSRHKDRISGSEDAQSYIPFNEVEDLNSTNIDSVSRVSKSSGEYIFEIDSQENSSLIDSERRSRP